MAEGQRHLAAIMFTDMVGYTALGQRNETLSLALVEEQRKVIRPVLARHNGREVKTMGDAFLVEFPNAIDAVRCAYDVQRAIREFNLGLSAESRIHLRVGIHVGEVVESSGDISGDAVNVASRIEPLAEDGGVCLTRQVYDHVSNKLDIPLVSLGPKPLKNVIEAVEVFRIQMPWDQPASSKEAAPLPRDRLAILPFRNMSPDPNDEYFAEGMTEEIISTVSGISGLNVISRTSVMGYKGTTKKVEEIGRELRAGSILEGSLRKSGNKIRVTTQLIDVAGDRHLWAQSYDRELNDAFEVQSDVAKQVAEALRVKIQAAEMERIAKKPTENAAAYSLYLRGRYHWGKRGVEDSRIAQECFEQAIKEDSGFALGYSGLADCHILLAINWQIDPSENQKRAKELVARALELDGELAEAHATKGLVLLTEYAFREAENEFLAAIALRPSYASAHQWYGHLLMAQMRLEEAAGQLEKALELDPFHPVISMNQAWISMVKRDYPRALELSKRALELDPTNVINRIVLANAYGRMKMFAEARREMDEAVRLGSGKFPTIAIQCEAIMAYLEDDREKVRSMMPELEKTNDVPFGFEATELAGFYVYLGMYDEAFRWLERSVERREPNLVYVRTTEYFDPVRSDPRYESVLKRIGLA